MMNRDFSLSPFTFILLLLALPLPLSWPFYQVYYPDVFVEFTSLYLYLSDIVIFLWLIVFMPQSLKALARATPFGLFQPAGRRFRNGVYPMGQIITLLLGLTILTGLSMLWANEPILAGIQTLRLIVLFLFVITLSQSTISWRVIIAGVAISLTLQSTVAIGQFAVQNDLGLRWLGELDLMTQAGGDSILFAEGQYWLRAYGLTSHPNILGGVLVVFTLMLIPAYLFERSRWRWGLLAVILLGIAALFFSFSRAAWLGGLGGGLFLVLWLFIKRSDRSQWLPNLIVLLVTALILAGFCGLRYRAILFSRITPTSNQLESRAVNERLTLTEAGLALWRERPLLGIGAANTPVAVVPLLEGVDNAGAQPIHNVPLLLGIELGPLGMILWILLMLLPPITIFQQPSDSQQALFLLGVTAALVAFAIIDQFDYYAWGWQTGRVLRWGLLGLAIGGVRYPVSDIRRSRDD